MEQLNFWFGTFTGQALIGFAIFVFVEIMAASRRLEAGFHLWPSGMDLLDTALNYAWVAVVVFETPFSDAIQVWTGLPEWEAMVLYYVLAFSPLLLKFELWRRRKESGAEFTFEEKLIDFRFSAVSYSVLGLMILPSWFIIPLEA